MTICPYDCTPCIDPSCRLDGCKQINETIHLICDACGDPVGRVNCLHLCVTCVQISERKISARKAGR